MIIREAVKSEIDLVEERYLETLRNIIQQFQQLPSALLSVPTKIDSELSLMDKLLSIKLSGPPDFVENFDAYLNEEIRFSWIRGLFWRW